MTPRPIRIRPFEVGDVDDLAALADEREVWRGVRDRFPHPYTRADAMGWIAANQPIEPALNLAVTIDGEFAGGVGLKPKDDVYRLTAELGYWVARPYWGSGVGTEAVRLMTEYAFRTFRYERLEAGVFDWNTASVRVLEKNGYRFEGRLRRAAIKDDEVCDVLMYARLRGD